MVVWMFLDPLSPLQVMCQVMNMLATVSTKFFVQQRFV